MTGIAFLVAAFVLGCGAGYGASGLQMLDIAEMRR